jgi:hypothetical protein
VHAEAEYPDRSIVRSAPIELDIADATTSSFGAAPPVAFSYTKKVIRDEPFLVELPAAYDTDFANSVYSVVTGPVQAAEVPGVSGPYRVMHPVDGASGYDTFTFEVQTPGGTSNQATVNLVYGGPPPNDDCITGPFLSDGAHAFDTIDATTDGFSEPGACTDFSGDVWYKYVASCAGLVTISVCDADYDTTLAVYTSCPTGSDQALYCSDDDCGVQSRIGFENAGPALYRIRVGGSGGQSGTGVLVVECDPCPADCAPAGGDATVDIQDLLALLAAWGTSGGPCDFAGGTPAGPDDVVDIQDLLALLSDWGDCL